MRNLVVVSESRAVLCLGLDHELEEGDELDQLAVDPFLAVLYILTKNRRLIVYESSINEVVYTANLREDIPVDTSVIACQFVPDLNAVCYATSAGDLIVYNTETRLAEGVGFVDSEIRAMGWSPDNEIFILVTGRKTVVSMTQQWDLIHEVPLFADPSDASDPSDEIWNPKQLPTISWRGDGQYFVVNSEELDGSSRRLRVWDRALVLDSTSTPEPSIGPAVSWRTSGSSIACSQVKASKKHAIIFYERNGLRLERMDFNLRETAGIETEIIAMQWNSASDVLALALRERNVKEGTTTTLLQLWHMNNYHWYLKQEFRYNAESELTSILWDTEHPMLLTAICRDGHVFRYHFCWDNIVSEGTHLNNPSTAAVIDGASILVTPFKYAVVPPPMYGFKLDCPAPVSSVAFAPQTYAIAALLSNHTIAIFEYSPALRPDVRVGIPPKLTRILSLSSKGDSNYRQLLWIGPGHLIAAESTTGEQDAIIEVHFNAEDIGIGGTDSKVERLLKTEIKGTEQHILRLAHNKDTNRAYVQLNDGSVWSYQPAVDRESPDMEPRFRFTPAGHATPCPWFASVTFAGQGEAFVGLTERSKLYVNNSLLSAECNSFAVHSRYLLFATLTHNLRLLSLTQQYEEGSLNVQTSAYDDTKRELERGSRIVCVVPNGARVVLQMPRGNLETINPRLLSLALVRELLDKHSYEAAFVMMRQQRIDLNLIYDNNPADFLEHAETFVKQVAKISYLNLFLSSLRNEDVTTTLFISEYKRKIPAALPANTTKVNLICDALRAVFNSLDAHRYLLPIITTHVKKDPPELEQALQLIRDLRNKQPVVTLDPLAEDNSENNAQKKETSAEDALDYAIFLVDVNALYNVALGTYDLDLVLMVAQKSQKDPKEYLPFLKNLRGQELYFQRYTIDMFLKRYPEALRNLAKAGEEHFRLCVSLIQRQSLYQMAWEIFKDDPAKMKEIIEVHADYLVSCDQTETAGYLYKQVGAHEKGIAAFRTACNWQMLFALCNEAAWDQDKIQAMAYDVAEGLQGFSRHAEAGIVLERYAEDPEQAIVVLTEGQVFTEALRLCHFHKRTDLIETHLKPALLEQHERWLSKLDKRQRRFLRHKERLPEVRATMRAQLLEMERGDENDRTDAASDISEASLVSATGSERPSVSSSVTSMASSRRSTTSSKKSQKGREKGYGRRKRVRGKEGSSNEEEWLISSMQKLVPTPAFLSEMKQLLAMLVSFGYNAQAQQLQQVLLGFIAVVDAAAETMQPENCVYVQQRKAEEERKTKERARIREAQLLVPGHAWVDPSSNENKPSSSRTATPSSGAAIAWKLPYWPTI